MTLSVADVISTSYPERTREEHCTQPSAFREHNEIDKETEDCWFWSPRLTMRNDLFNAFTEPNGVFSLRITPWKTCDLVGFVLNEINALSSPSSASSWRRYRNLALPLRLSIHRTRTQRSPEHASRTKLLSLQHTALNGMLIFSSAMKPSHSEYNDIFARTRLLKRGNELTKTYLHRIPLLDSLPALNDNRTPTTGSHSAQRTPTHRTQRAPAHVFPASRSGNPSPLLPHRQNPGQLGLLPKLPILTELYL
ncbi:uncharacterized protein MKK02DRAFT_30832 [Dioszegia hungarica]|uniref:Uncharacterized protein n=1 Tax=Dioszegia hungarica TaxID=4972 RepID=A0AA38H156_9TREE|nr:uncharacterized protein MKK02DRAFT_30832 [Dioszegia hungarica]KAI9631836.1 hypothetical protein MKK02DRAFT_30832 [Dioszegia hungarica]